MKVNTDGSTFGSLGPAKCGGVFRNCRKFVSGCFAFPIEFGFSYEVKILAIIYVVGLARSSGWNKLWIEANSDYVVDLIKNGPLNVPWKLHKDCDCVHKDCHCVFSSTLDVFYGFSYIQIGQSSSG